MSDEQRRDLLAGATLLAYPSLYEGFGLPPLEAMAAGVPVVAAARGAIPEIVGPAALLVDPTDADDLAAGIVTLTTDDTRREAFVTAGRERAAGFDWRTTVNGFVDLYTDLARNR